jgi:hypothetical protein
MSLPWDDPNSDPAQDCANVLGAPVFGRRPSPTNCARKDEHEAVPCEWCGAVRHTTGDAMTEPLDLEAIKTRNELAETIASYPVGPFMDAWLRSARDVPAIIAEVERLREAVAENTERTWRQRFNRSHDHDKCWDDDDCRAKYETWLNAQA